MDRSFAGGHIRGRSTRYQKICQRRASRAHPLHGRGRREMSRRFLATSLFSLLIVPTYSRAQQTPPPPAAPRVGRVSHPTERTLDNGLRVIVIEKTGLPLVAARLLVKSGAEMDSDDRGGLADMTASLLTKGTKTKSAEQIALGVEALGATIDSGAGWDNSYVTLGALADNFPQAMNYVADVVLHPTFAQDEIDRLRDQNIDALRVAMQNPGQLASFVASRVLYGGAPYGHNQGGTPESLQKITRDDVVKFHQTYYRPDNAVLVVAGDVKSADVFAVAQKLFGAWSHRVEAMPPAAFQKTPVAAQPHIVVVDMPEAGQAAVVVTRPGLRRTDPDYYKAIVSNAVLGAGYSSRLNQEIRIKRGLSYGAGSAFEFRRAAGPFFATAQTKNESAGEVASIINEQLSALTSTSVPESELTPRKAVLLGNFGRALETEAGLVSRVATLALYGLPLGDLSHYISDVQGVT